MSAPSPAIVPISERTKVCHHVINKLKEFFPNLPDSDIIQRTRAFEYQQFSTCKSRQEYLQRISDGISNVQQVAQRQAPLNRSSNSNQNCQQQPQPQHYQYQHHHQNHGQQQIAHTMTATQLRYLPGGSAQPTDAFPQAHNHPSNPSMMDHFPPSQFNRQVATQDQFVISGHAQRCPQHSLHPAVFQPPQVCCEQPSHMTHVPSTYFQPSPPPVGITPNHSSTCMPSPRANFSADVSLSNVEASNFSNMELNGVNTSTGSLAKVSQESYSIADTTLENISVPGVTANKFSAHDSQFDEIVPSLSEEQKSAKEKRQALCKARAVVRKNRLKRIRQGNEQVQPATNEVTGLCDSHKRPRLEIQGLESMNFVHLFPIEGSTGQSMNREEVNLVSKRIRNIQKQYSKTIQVLGPIVENFQEMQSQQGREKFAKKLRWVAKMLSVQSTEDIPKWLNLEVLDRAERFVVELIRSYVPRLKKIIRDSTATPERKVELTRRIEDCVLPAYEFARKNPHSLGPYSLQYAHINILFQPTRTKSCEVPSTTPPLFSVGSQNQLELYRQGHVHSTTYVPKSHSSQEIYADPGNNDSNVSTTDVLRGQGTSASQSEMQSESHSSIGISSAPSVVSPSFSAGFPTWIQEKKPLPNAVFAYFSGTSLSGARSSEGAQAKKTYEKEEQHTREAIVEGTKTLPAVSQMPSRSVNLKKRDDQSSMSIPSPPDIICQDSIRLNVQNIIKESRPVRQHEQQEYRSAMTALKNTFANKFSNDSNRSPSTQQQPFLQQRKISTGNSKRPYEHKTGRENRKDNNIAVDEKLKDPTSYLGVPTGTSEISSELARGLRQRYQNMTKSVCEAYNQAKMLKDLMRQKKERTNNTISAILHNTDTKCRKSQQGDTQTKDNLSHDSVINTKHVFLCSSDDGLKSGKNDTRNRLQQNSTRSALKEDCKAAEARNPSLIIDILEEFGKPVVSCLLDIPEIRLPKLFLRVQNGYPRRSGTTYSFESPPMGWSNVVGLIRAEFIQSLEKTPGKYVCVGGVLEAWAKAASVILTTSNNDNRNEPLQKLRS